MKLTFGNKKGSVNDPITVGAVILTVFMTAFIMMYVWFAFSDQISSVVQNSPANESVQGVLTDLTLTYSYLDYMMPMLVGGLMIVSLILAFKTGAGVIYMFLSYIAWGFAILMATVYTNVFEEFGTAFPTVSGEFPIMVYIMGNFKWIVLGWVFLISLVMFTKNSRESKELNSGLEQYYA